MTDKKEDKPSGTIPVIEEEKVVNTPPVTPSVVPPVVNSTPANSVNVAPTSQPVAPVVAPTPIANEVDNKNNLDKTQFFDVFSTHSE